MSTGCNKPREMAMAGVRRGPLEGEKRKYKMQRHHYGSFKIPKLYAQVGQAGPGRVQASNALPPLQNKSVIWTQTALQNKS